MTLTDLLQATSFCLQVTCAIGAAKAAHSSPLGYLLAVVIGVIVGMLWVWIAHRTLGRYVNATQHRSERTRWWLDRAMLAGWLLWILGGSFFTGNLVTVLHL